jgi:hypothetical protein
MKTLAHIWKLFVAFVREVADESAYARHLQRTGRPHSRAEWRVFSDQRHRNKYQNAKCC